MQQSTCLQLDVVPTDNIDYLGISASTVTGLNRVIFTTELGQSIVAGRVGGSPSVS